jgi:hypothetical protein
MTNRAIACGLDGTRRSPGVGSRQHCLQTADAVTGCPFLSRDSSESMIASARAVTRDELLSEISRNGILGEYA